MTETLRRTIRNSGQSMYELAKGSGLSWAVVARFAKGTQSIRLDLADRLAGYLGLELRPRAGSSAPRRTPRRKGD